jgi:hypothetical protein
MWAWADSYDVFNTAALTGQQVSTAIRGMAVKSYAWGTPNTNTGDTLSNCMLSSGAAQATAALAGANAVCMVHVNAVNTAPAKGLAVTVAVAAGMPPDPSTQVGCMFEHYSVSESRCCSSMRDSSRTQGAECGGTSVSTAQYHTYRVMCIKVC